MISLLHYDFGIRWLVDLEDIPYASLLITSVNRDWTIMMVIESISLILYFRVTRYQLSVYQLLVRSFIDDHMTCSEFIWVGKYLYQLLVVGDTICISGYISSILFQMSDITVVRYHSCQISQLSDISFQLSVVRLSAIIDITSCWRYCWPKRLHSPFV